MKNYVKVFDGQEVPSGTKYYSKADVNQRSYFYDEKGKSIGDKSAFVIYFSDLMELPEQPMPSKAEWMPTGRCIHIYGGGVATREEEEVNIIGIDKLGNYVFQNDKSTCYYSDPASEFRPLKTAEEKKREAIKEIVINSIDTSKFKISEMGAIAEFLNQMIDKFDVIPAGDK